MKANKTIEEPTRVNLSFANGENGTYVDDDNFFSDSVSWRRRLSIVEKILIIVTAIITIPLTSAIGYAIDPQAFNPFALESFLITLPSYLLAFIVLIYAELGTKNISVNKGVLITTFASIFISVAANEASFALLIPFRKVFAGNAETDLINQLPYFLALGGIAAASYTVILFFTRMILVLINRSNKKYAIIIGPQKDAEVLSRKIIKEDKRRLSVRYIFYEQNKQISDRIYAEVKKVNTVILLDTLSAKNKEKFLLYFNSSLNKDVYVCSNYYDIILLSNTPKNINEKFAFEQSPLFIDTVEAFSKRAWDLLFSLIAMILILPVWLFCPLVIKLQDGGPVFYTQTRLTKNMKPFKIIKFRSMKVDAEKNGAQLAGENDKRITAFGHFIRATRIDELPQILNIIKGDMSWVGPRPERPEFVNGFLKKEPLYRYRYNVKAGLTGLQQVSSTYHTEFSDKLEYDLYYIANQSTLLDFIILFRTVGVVLQKGMAEGVDDSTTAFSDFLLEQGVLSRVHWDYRSLIYENSVDRGKQELLQETIELTMDIGLFKSEGGKESKPGRSKNAPESSKSEKRR